MLTLISKTSLAIAFILSVSACIPTPKETGPSKSQLSDVTPYFQAKHQDWLFWIVAEDDQKICYVLSQPKEQTGTYTRRGKPAVLVTRRPVPTVRPIYEVSVQPGYKYLEGSSVDVTVGKSQFTLFTRGVHAWTKDETEDQALIDVMRQGESMIISGESSRNATSTDTYSLLGFKEAYNNMEKDCSKEADAPISG